MRKIVIDGYNYSGKSELVSDIQINISDALVFQTFDSNIGEFFMWLYNNKRYRLANDVLLNTVFMKDICNKNVYGEDDNLIIYDTHWLTMFSILPEKYWSTWFPLPKTIICWASGNKTIENMINSGLKQVFCGGVDYNCKLYFEIAQMFICEHIKFIDTTKIERNAVLDQALEFIGCN